MIEPFLFRTPDVQFTYIIKSNNFLVILLQILFA